jgi:hypothetical protein
MAMTDNRVTCASSEHSELEWIRQVLLDRFLPIKYQSRVGLYITELCKFVSSHNKYIGKNTNCNGDYVMMSSEKSTTIQAKLEMLGSLNHP